jgi:hypothetical protein
MHGRNLFHSFYSLLEIATLTTAYTATGPDQLSLVPGQYIAVKAKNANGWWEGQLQVNISCLYRTSTQYIFASVASLACENELL